MAYLRLPCERLRHHHADAREWRLLRVRGAATLEPEMVVDRDPVPELVDEARLADARLARDADDPPAPVTHAAPVLLQLRQLGVATHERRLLAVERRVGRVCGTEDAAAARGADPPP